MLYDISSRSADRVYRPTGEPYSDGSPLRGSLELPEETAGMWSFLPLKIGTISMEDAEPLLALGSEENYFAPDVSR